MLKEKTLFEGNVDKVNIAIKRLKAFEPKEGYYLAFSGGKDSIVIKRLAEMSGVKFDSHYMDTTIDPPDLVKFIKKYHSDVIRHRPEESFFKLLVRRGFPQRQRRWCCEYLKEKGGEGRKVVTGIRWAESPRRAKRGMVEACFKDKRKHYINVIIDWTADDVWSFIKQENLPYCSLYDEGWKRVGCLMCPNSTRRKQDADKYPKYKKAFELNFEKLYKEKKRRGFTSVDRWKDGKEMFDWWLNEKKTKDVPGQGVLFE